MPGIIGGEHSFILTPVDGGTRLVQSETFRGLLVPFSGKTLAATESGYQALNKALTPGCYPAWAGGLWLCRILVFPGFQAVVVPSGLRTTVQPILWITT